MYNDVGKTIKNLVSIVVMIGYALSILGAIVLAVIGFGYGFEHFGLMLLFLFIAAIVGVLGCFASWAGGLWLYAYGEIADRLISIDNRVEQIENHLSEDIVTSVTASAAPTRSPFAPTPVTAKPAGAGAWKCSCGRENASYMSTCACGINKREIKK